MSKRTHYEVLGLKPDASLQEIRSSYRKIVFEHHPDRSKDPGSPAIFFAATEAHEVLSDTERRRSYDELLRMDRIKEEQRRLRHFSEEQKRNTGSKAPEAPKPSQPAAPKNVAAPGNPSFRQGAKGSTTVSVTRLTMLYTRGMMGEAERLAKKILEEDPRQPIPYAVLGDVERSRGRMAQALKMYAYAVQMDPMNPIYQDRYEEVLGAMKPSERAASMNGHESAGGLETIAPLIGIAVVVMGAFYLAVAHETPLMVSIAMIKSWTLGVFIWLFLAGVAIGASLSVGKLLDRFSSVAMTATGKITPALALASVAIVNFWAAAVLYAVIGAALKSFTFSISRLIGGIALSLMLLALACAIGGTASPFQVFLWGGNVMYVGSLCGWMVADSFAR